MLKRELGKATSKLTSDLKQDFQDFGCRLDSIESKVDDTVHRVAQNITMITKLHDGLEEAYTKIDNLENHTRQYNFCIRGLPETVKDITSITSSLIQSAVPDIDETHMKIDRIHTTLVPLKPDGLPGPPRDVIVKPHFFRVKEAVMQYAREHPGTSRPGS